MALADPEGCRPVILSLRDPVVDGADGPRLAWAPRPGGLGVLAGVARVGRCRCSIAAEACGGSGVVGRFRRLAGVGVGGHFAVGRFVDEAEYFLCPRR